MFGWVLAGVTGPRSFASEAVAKAENEVRTAWTAKAGGGSLRIVVRGYRGRPPTQRYLGQLRTFAEQLAASGDLKPAVRFTEVLGWSFENHPEVELSGNALTLPLSHPALALASVLKEGRDAPVVRQLRKVRAAELSAIFRSKRPELLEAYASAAAFCESFDGSAGRLEPEGTTVHRAGPQLVRRVLETRSASGGRSELLVRAFATEKGWSTARALHTFRFDALCDVWAVEAFEYDGAGSLTARTLLDGNLHEIARVAAPQWRDFAPAATMGPLVAILDTGFDADSVLGARVAGAAQVTRTRELWTELRARRNRGEDTASLRAKIEASSPGWDFISDDPFPEDFDGGFYELSSGLFEQENARHGTLMAEVVQQTAAPAAVTLLPLRVLRGAGRSRLADAIHYAARRGARVVLMSFAFPDREDTETVRAAILDHPDMVFIAAAGNNDGRDLDARPLFPAHIQAPHLLSVAATVSETESRLAPYSNYGVETVTFAVSGDWPHADGTSVAAARLAGWVARMLAQWPELSPPDVRERLAQDLAPAEALRGFIVHPGRIQSEKLVPLTRFGRRDRETAEP